MLLVKQWQDCCFLDTVWATDGEPFNVLISDILLLPKYVPLVVSIDIGGLDIIAGAEVFLLLVIACLIDDKNVLFGAASAIMIKIFFFFFCF